MNELTDRLMDMWNLYIGIFTQELVESGITKPQIMVIHQVKENPKTIGEISKSLELSYSTVSGIIDRLEKANLVIRKRDHNDRRIVWVFLAQDFSQLQKRFPLMKDQYLPELFEGMKEHERKQITQSLELLNHYLEKKYHSLLKERGNRDEHFKVCD
ncbi:MarR family winged helix-turn-helix transcriptional regulator [Brevibacillus laterosporus]|uniref:Transcriptional repressor MprA n=1 Tax=Brevibacillus laterosporus LMG 15441 TaxID=1042163 RepID=A0A075R8N0_BRELA|nr:MarR family transcriptional regulator [Brevibacillus laterosporus]HAS01878.1 transcriptional regulator [Brevibacillus sp.]AIG28214.1 transcriptional repressor MprA [Brevibacillus laterosporus LMG 15441]AUM66588.1 transcriptional regulator [Brevibacillus laterosporus]AYK05458.1 MarR family transcriptional regulator [Brevibacillus laterosporus]ERM17225.1 transcriptional regulator [Brevibacillus laterosporus PE36]